MCGINMEFVLKKKDVVVLADKHNYMVHTLFEYEGVGYLYLIRVSDLKKSEPVVFFAREYIKDEKLFLDVIKDSTLIKKLASRLEEIYIEEE